MEMNQTLENINYHLCLDVGTTVLHYERQPKKKLNKIILRGTWICFHIFTLFYVLYEVNKNKWRIE